VRDNGYRYLAVSREQQCRTDAKSGHGIHLYKELSGDGAEARLICFSEQCAEKERATADLHAADRHKSSVPFAEVRVGFTPGVPQQRSGRRVICSSPWSPAS